MAVPRLATQRSAPPQVVSQPGANPILVLDAPLTQVLLMTLENTPCRSGWLHLGCVLCLGLVWLGQPARVDAICSLNLALFAPLREVRSPDAARAWSRQIRQQGETSCIVCHLASFGPRNRYGSAINVLLNGNDREDSARQREAGRRVSQLPADPTLPDSPTFGELMRQGRLPASERTAEWSTFSQRAARPLERITVQQARDLARQVEAESRFGILQLSDTTEMTSEVAAELAQFRGEMLILGLRSLPLDVAQALAQSQAATVWLHSLTSVSPDAAEALAQVPGQLVVSGLVELLSQPLAEKLARRPASLSFPYLKQLTPGTAAALARTSRSLNLGGLAEVSPEIQDRLADTVGALTLPQLSSLDSPALTKKLAAGYSQSVLLPALRSLSVDQAREIAAVKRNFFWGGSWLPGNVLTAELAQVFADNPAAGRLHLAGQAISSPALAILVPSQVPLELPDVQTLDETSLQILETAAPSVPGGPFGRRPKLGLPGVTRLDSPRLATTLLRSASGFQGITELSPAAAEALARATNEEAAGAVPGKPVRGQRGLSFPNLRELSPETAQRLLAGSWGAISLPEVSDVSPDTLRRLARSTSHLTLGITRLSPELATAFEDLASNPGDLGGGILTLPELVDLSPEAASRLARALNRGEEVKSFGGLTRSPQLFLGGRNPMGFSIPGSCPSLTPELAAQLANYRGLLSISGLQELSPRAAAALAGYRGPRLDLSGPATEQLSPEAAAALSRCAVQLNIPLRVLDSVPLADKIARQSSWMGGDVEFLAPDAIEPLVGYNGFFELRRLRVLDSPVLAARLSQNSTGPILPSLRSISLAAAEVLAESPQPTHLGLTLLDDPAVARALAKSRTGTFLRKLQAATPEVVTILQSAKSITTPPLDSLFLLPDRPPQ